MAKVTQIKPQKNQKRFNIYLDGKFCFALPAETLVKAGITIGQELTEKEIKNLVFKNEFQKLLDRTLKFISLRPRSKREVVNYLKRKKADPGLIDRLLGRLESLGQIDDDAFAAWWLDQRASFRPRGKMALRLELSRKGIDREIIREKLEEVDELSLAKKAAAKKLRVYKRLPPLKFRQKVSAFLSRQGFSWEVINEILSA